MAASAEAFSVRHHPDPPCMKTSVSYAGYARLESVRLPADAHRAAMERRTKALDATRYPPPQYGKRPLRTSCCDSDVRRTVSSAPGVTTDSTTVSNR